MAFISQELEMFKIIRSQRVLVLPPIKSVVDIDIKYALIPPFAFANARWDNENNSLMYYIIEPLLTERERAVYDKLAECLTKTLGVELEKLGEQKKLIDYLKERVLQIIVEYKIDIRPRELTKVMYYIYRNFVGLNQLEPLFYDPYIEDIGCDGIGIPIYIIHKKYGSMRTNIVFNDVDELTNFIVKLAERAGRYVSYAEPLLDGTLPDGSRVQATYATDITTKGPTFSIRRFSAVPYSIVDQIKMKTASAELFAYLWLLIEYKCNVLIVGGTAAGKTSFLNSLIAFIPPEDKIVSIEDTRELNIPHQNWIPAVTRQGFGAVAEGERKYGEVTMFDLLKESFRQNPDYVIVGEVRGKEASILFQGMASGHPSFGTMHAGSIDEVIKRLVTPPINLSTNLVEALDVAIIIQHASQLARSARRIKKVEEIVSVDKSGRALTSESFIWQPTSDIIEKKHTIMYDKLSTEYGIPVKTLEDWVAERENVIKWLLDNNIAEFQEVASYISLYYKDKKRLFELMRARSPQLPAEAKKELEYKTPKQKVKVSTSKVKEVKKEANKKIKEFIKGRKPIAEKFPSFSST